MSNKTLEKNYITPGGLKHLTDEYDFLVKVERPKTVEVVKWAASLGDRSENADYQYGKKKLREIDRRLRFLNSRIESAECVDPRETSSKKVQFGATVSCEDEDGKRKLFIIVGVDESEPAKNRVSWKSPIGRSLLGKEVGDDVNVKTPNGEYELCIAEIQYLEIKTEPWSSS